MFCVRISYFLVVSVAEAGVWLLPGLAERLSVRGAEPVLSLEAAAASPAGASSPFCFALI